MQVSLGMRTYPIVVEPGLLARAADLALDAVPATSVAVISHPHVASLYGPAILRGLERRRVPAHLITVPAGERHKHLRTVARIYDALLEHGIDRKSLVITLGGGVIGDMGGFAAATYLRGIPFVQVPTTLLAQVDASVGGKTGVDLRGGKNLVGAFHQPRAVLIDPDTLATLPARELRSGLAEVVKHGIICDEGFFEWFRREAPRLLRRDAPALCHAILRSCEIKSSIVGQDETEQGLRAVLNYGHTVGHALEAVTGYRRYKHGEAVSVGMVSAALVGEELGLTPADVTGRVVEALRAARLPTDLPSDVAPASVVEAMRRDKKVVAGLLRFVLVTAIGRVRQVGDVPEAVVYAALARHGSR